MPSNEKIKNETINNHQLFDIYLSTIVYTLLRQLPTFPHFFFFKCLLALLKTSPKSSIPFTDLDFFKSKSSNTSSKPCLPTASVFLYDIRERERDGENIKDIEYVIGFRLNWVCFHCFRFLKKRQRKTEIIMSNINICIIQSNKEGKKKMSNLQLPRL